MGMKLENASQFPKTYYCRHMQPGIARYENETVLVDNDAMKNLIGSAKNMNIPVYINHQNVDLKNIKSEAAGYVSESFYNEKDGWAWFKFIAIDDEMHNAIKKGWSVSNAYLPSEWGPAGTKINCPYHREVKNGQFTHLAIVPDPRYEGACIMTPEEFKNYQDENDKRLAELKNSKEKKSMFKFFKNDKKEVSGAEIDADTEIQLANGKSVKIGDMIAAVEKQNSQEEQTVEVAGKAIKVSDLVASYEKLNAKGKMKKNEDEDKTEEEGEQAPKKKGEEASDAKKNKKTKKNEAEMEEEDCENSDEDEADEDEDKEAKKPKSEKKNSIKTVTVEKSDEYFNAMKNAHLKNEAEKKPLISTSMDQIARGKQRYGSAPVKK
jgi:hypothetical protein